MAAVFWSVITGHAGLQVAAGDLGHAAVADAGRHRHGHRLRRRAAPRPGAPAPCWRRRRPALRVRRPGRRGIRLDDDAAACAAGGAPAAAAGVKRSAVLGTSSTSLALGGGDGGGGRHAGAQAQVGVVDVEVGQVGDHVVGDGRAEAHARDAWPGSGAPGRR